ncbi:MAG: hypothetical protein ACTSP5_13380, partial [Candidatus Heimdallarchaeota archaeon]
RGLFYVPKMILKIARTLELNVFQMLQFMILLGVLVKKNNNNIHPENQADDVLGIITKMLLQSSNFSKILTLSLLNKISNIQNHTQKV